MNRPLKAIFTLTTFLLLIASDSCTPGSCFEETNAYLKGFFYLQSASKAYPPDSLTMYGLGRDTSLIYSKARNVRPALIPLDASTESSTLVMNINGIIDTVEFVYSSKIHFISSECGYTFYFNIESLNFTTNIIDTVTITKANVTTLNEENIRIYY